ncbi:hypothetical protein CFP56_001593 [Quercus suber]|uniref:Zinc knuckle CX2CX4HX4C domain-containing protein n=1 Tax=Quercus suber TaxID=58331 RepID=A0AAW0IL94_QUESU
MDITKPLTRCSKLWADGKQIGWVDIKYERLLNFCYWCGCVSHGERDCAVWLQAKGKLRKEDQQYGEWLQVDPVISGASQSQAPWWRKQNGPLKKLGNQPGNTAPEQPQDDNGSRSATTMESNENLVDVDSSNEFGNPLPLHLQTTRWAQTPRTDLQAKKRHRDSATASPPVVGDGLIRGSLTMLLLSATGSRILLEFGNPLPLHLQTKRWAQTPRTDLQAKKRHRDSATASPPVVGDGLIRGSLTMLLLSATGSRILLLSARKVKYFACPGYLK